jgi:ABC-type amino acid transport substrate-binding protein
MMIVRPQQRFISSPRFIGKIGVLLLAAAFFSIFHFSTTAFTEKVENTVSLTAEEQAWINAHPLIRLAVDQHYEPRAYLDKNGILKGISVEFARLFEKKLGLKIELVGSTWKTALDRAVKYEVDGIMNVAVLEERKRYLNFTDVYVASPQAVLANEREPMISGLDALCGRKMGVTGKTSQNDYLRDNFPCIERVELASVEDGLVALTTGRVDALFGNFDVLISKSRAMLLVNLKAIYFEYLPPAGFSRIGVRKDEPLLRQLLSKTIASITEKERDRILTKWYGTNIPPLPSNLKQQEKLELTPEEQAWLAQDHTVRVRVVDLPPVIKVKKGQKPTGISIDFLNLTADRTGIKLKYIVSARPFAEALKSMQNQNGPDLITSVMRTPDREKTLLLSKPYLSIPRLIFTRTDGQFISDMDDLIGRSIAVPRGTVIQKQIQARYPQIKLLLFDTDLESLEAIAADRADAYVGNLTLASYLIDRRGLSNLKVAASSPFGDHVFSFGS